MLINICSDQYSAANKLIIPVLLKYNTINQIQEDKFLMSIQLALTACTGRTVLLIHTCIGALLHTAIPCILMALIVIREEVSLKLHVCFEATTCIHFMQVR